MSTKKLTKRPKLFYSVENFDQLFLFIAFEYQPDSEITSQTVEEAEQDDEKVRTQVK